jgi:hypothetical protein
MGFVFVRLSNRLATSLDLLSRAGVVAGRSIGAEVRVRRVCSADDEKGEDRLASEDEEVEEQ